METTALKESSVDWIKRIPNNWNTLSLLYVLRKPITDGPHETPNYVDEGIPFISVDSIKDGEEIDLSVVRKFISEEDFKKYETKTKLENQDLLFTKAATIGKTAIVNTNEKFMIWSPLALIKPDASKINYKFLYYVLSSEEYINYVIKLGSFNTQSNVGMRTLEKSKIPFPASVREQELIASYLDMKCSKIDSIINDLEKQIEILEKYKKSVITEAVTKGLNPDDEMKESCVDWIGKIPSRWGITRFQDIAFFKKGPFGSALTISMFVDKSEDSIKVYEQKNAIKKDYSLGEYYISKSYFGAMRNFEVHPGDVIVSCAGTIGECYVMPESMEKGIINQALMRVKFSDGISKKYYLYIFDFLITEQSATDSNGSAMKNIPPLNVLKKYKVPLPSLVEQIKISDFLDKKCAEIESIIEDKKNQVDTIKKYKNSLIYEYVTGKKRVGQGDANE